MRLFSEWPASNQWNVMRSRGLNGTPLMRLEIPFDLRWTYFDSSFSTIISLVGVAFLAPAAMAKSVCKPGEIGIVNRAAAQHTGGVAQLTLYSGSIIEGSNCQIQASNGLTQNWNQWCRGGYNNGAYVECDNGNTNPLHAGVNGKTYRCYNNSNRSCDLPGFIVGSCCYRLT